MKQALTVPDKPLNTNSYDETSGFLLAINKNSDISTNELPGSEMYMFSTKIVSQNSQSSIAILFFFFTFNTVLPTVNLPTPLEQTQTAVCESCFPIQVGTGEKPETQMN